MRRLVFGFGVFILLVLSIGIVFAEEGQRSESCFLHPDSDFYCQEIPLDIAEVECLGLDNCVLDVLYPGASCSFFDECEQIMCQSTCTDTALGSCTFGEIPSGQERSWCTASCCRFSGNNGPYCGMSSNEWECQILADNNGADSYSYDNVPLAACESECVLPSYGKEVLLRDVSSFRVYDFELQSGGLEPIATKEGQVREERVASNVQNSLETNSSNGEDNGRSLFMFAFVACLVFIGIVIYLKTSQKSDDGMGESEFKPSDQTLLPREMQSSASNVGEKESFEIPSNFDVGVISENHPTRHHPERKAQHVALEFEGYGDSQEGTYLRHNSGLDRLGHFVKRHEKKKGRRLDNSELKDRAEKHKDSTDPFAKLSKLGK